MEEPTKYATFLVTVPESDVRFFKQIAKRLDWKVGRRRKSPLEEALEDVKAGRLSGPYSCADEIFEDLGIEAAATHKPRPERAAPHSPGQSEEMKSPNGTLGSPCGTVGAL